MNIKLSDLGIDFCFFIQEQAEKRGVNLPLHEIISQQTCVLAGVNAITKCITNGSLIKITLVDDSISDEAPILKENKFRLFQDTGVFS